MRAIVKKWGNSASVRIPAALMDAANLELDDVVEMRLCCPLTTQIKGYPFEVLIAGKSPSAALADQVKSLDWIVRKAKRKGRAAPGELTEVRAKIFALVEGS